MKSPSSSLRERGIRGCGSKKPRRSPIFFPPTGGGLFHLPRLPLGKQGDPLIGSPAPEPSTGRIRATLLIFCLVIGFRACGRGGGSAPRPRKPFGKGLTENFYVLMRYPRRPQTLKFPKEKAPSRELYLRLNYFIASSTATAQATEAPTIGLLPIPIRPIIST